MTPTRQMPRAFRWCGKLIPLIFLATLVTSQPAHAQGLELNGGWTHQTENSGTDGFEVGFGWWLSKRLSIAVNYDSAWDTTSLTNFAVTNGGLVTTHSHVQNALVGPRFFFATNWTTKHKLVPFAEAQFGESWLDQKITRPSMADLASSEHGFSWMLGGGVERVFARHWSGRVNVDLLRTHLADLGHSSVRLVFGITYTRGQR